MSKNSEKFLNHFSKPRVMSLKFLFWSTNSPKLPLIQFTIIQKKNAANSHMWEAGNREHLTFCLKNYFIIKIQIEWQNHFSSSFYLFIPYLYYIIIQSKPSHCKKGFEKPFSKSL